VEPEASIETEPSDDPSLKILHIRLHGSAHEWRVRIVRYQQEPREIWGWELSRDGLIFPHGEAGRKSAWATFDFARNDALNHIREHEHRHPNNEET
jgi:hypothetical protein